MEWVFTWVIRVSYLQLGERIQTLPGL